MSAASRTMRGNLYSSSKAFEASIRRRAGERQMSIIATVEQLEAIYGQPNEASTVKVADKITPQYPALIDKSPFAAPAPCRPAARDCSPRPWLSGFLRVH